MMLLTIYSFGMEKAAVEFQLRKKSTCFSRLYKYLSELFREVCSEIHVWSDTNIVLYWIPQLIRKINRCLACKKYSVKSADQLSGQLPRDRISESPPFTVIGFDFTGPVYVKLGNDTEKSYIALFKCAVTRAVHIELVTGLSARKFILALRRFHSRRSNCKTIYSDNVSTFKCANKEIRYFFNIIKDENFKIFISAEGITWKFIVELAPWWGGFYERLMRSFKEPLRKIIGKCHLKFEETMTIIAEIENVLHHRPLTYVYDDVSDPEPLTPANFLLVGHKNDYPFNFSELLNNSITRESLLKRKYYQTKLLSQFWKKWKDNYLLNIRSFHHFPKPSVERNLRVGDGVILEGNTKSKFFMGFRSHS
ncbi:transposable element Tcb2 transposase [Trichonephila clavata]|uniref:Transposable element Tcb2 transposase n=1 Tax=Trichonephila clavata TaxID=2740835 RepID=A0A8X6IYL5_TRICU|nr:transposable element Tcb2 transposase [Trichonephila clavata]